MFLTLDPTGFPLLKLPSLGLAVHLLPVTKVQFEYFLGEPALIRRFDTALYEEMCHFNPRTSWRRSSGVPESLFATGILPPEAEAYGTWMGKGFRLPKDTEWRAVDAEMALHVEDKAYEFLLTDRRIHPAARAIISQQPRKPGQWRQFGLFENGFLEWVCSRDGFRLQGRPRPALRRVIHNPQLHDAIRVQLERLSRDRAFGFRLVKTLPAGGGV